MRNAHGAIEDALERLRDATFDLHPTVLDQCGLDAALDALLERHGARAGFTGALRIEREAVGVHDQLVFAVTRELVLNAAKHSHASRVDVTVARTLSQAMIPSLIDELPLLRPVFTMVGGQAVYDPEVMLGKPS